MQIIYVITDDQKVYAWERNELVFEFDDARFQISLTSGSSQFTGMRASRLARYGKTSTDRTGIFSIDNPRPQPQIVSH
jgi:hypothetical protein